MIEDGASNTCDEVPFLNVLLYPENSLSIGRCLKNDRNKGYEAERDVKQVFLSFSSLKKRLHVWVDYSLAIMKS